MRKGEGEERKKKEITDRAVFGEMTNFLVRLKLIHLFGSRTGFCFLPVCGENDTLRV
jgi:hypothetical protein